MTDKSPNDFHAEAKPVINVPIIIEKLGSQMENSESIDQQVLGTMEVI